MKSVLKAQTTEECGGCYWGIFGKKADGGECHAGPPQIAHVIGAVVEGERVGELARFTVTYAPMQDGACGPTTSWPSVRRETIGCGSWKAGRLMGLIRTKDGDWYSGGLSLSDEDADGHEKSYIKRYENAHPDRTE